LHANLQGLQWVITAYALTLAAFTITGGRLGDLFGRKKMFMTGAVIFAVGSFVASISSSVGMLLVGESIIEGIGAALMMPATSSLLVANYKGRDRAVAFGIWGGIAGASSAIGPIIGGFLTTNYSWRWAFRINLFVALGLLVGSLIISESRDRSEKQELDFVGVFLSAVGLLAFVYGIIESATFGWWKGTGNFEVLGHTLPFGLSPTPIALVIGTVLLGLFAWWQLRIEKQGHTPLVSLGLFKNKQFTSGALVMAFLSLGMVGLIFALPVFLQSVRNLSSLDTGLALLPMSLVMLVVAPGSAALSKHVTAKRLIQAGLLFAMLASFVLHAEINAAATAADFIPGLMLFGLGMGLVMAQVSNLTLSAVSVEQSGEASGVNNTLRQVGSSFGSAIIGAVLLATLTSSLAGGINKSTVIPENQKAQLSQSVAQQAANVELGGVSSDTTSKLDPAVDAELTNIVHTASADGSRKAILYTGLFAGVGFLIAFMLPNDMNLDRHAEASVSAGH
jgi:EmrB/QacA subfamily drug resistance transporter